MRRKDLALLGAILWLAAGPAMAAKADLPEGATLSFCHGYGCEIRTLVRLTPKDMVTLKAIVAKGKANPALLD